MHIELWSDFACPYCYIGEARLKRALKALGAEQEVTITMKSFELDPTAPRAVVSTTLERFARKYGMSLPAAQAQIDHISQLGRDEGIAFNYATTNYTNMLDAHRLAKYGVEQGHDAIVEALFGAYFTENMNLADHATLLRLAEGVGLNVRETQTMLSSDAYKDLVRQDEQEAASMGIHGVPYFSIDKKLAISGAQPYTMLCQTLGDLLAHEHVSVADSSTLCDATGCRFERAGSFFG